MIRYLHNSLTMTTFSTPLVQPPIYISQSTIVCCMLKILRLAMQLTRVESNHNKKYNIVVSYASSANMPSTIALPPSVSTTPLLKMFRKISPSPA